MCGRYRRCSDKQRIAEAFAVNAGLEDLYLEPEDNIAPEAVPGSLQPVIRVMASGERLIEMMRWGFQRGDRKLLFNARAEGVQQVNLWRDSFLERRCIVPADSFFEWKKVESGRKPKFEITVRGGELFGMAGLWSPRRNPKTGGWEDAFVIMTVAANERMAEVHHRQPAILEASDFSVYLAPSLPPPVHLLKSSPGDEMTIAAAGADVTAGTQANLFRG